MQPYDKNPDTPLLFTKFSLPLMGLSSTPVICELFTFILFKLIIKEVGHTRKSKLCKVALSL